MELLTHAFKYYKGVISEAGVVFAHGTTGAKRTVGAPPSLHKNLQKKIATLCNIVTATSLLK
jgi:hypothetical protein